jgi:hypothetical protein
VAGTTSAQVSVQPTKVGPTTSAAEATTSAAEATTSAAEESAVAVAGVKAGGGGLAPTGAGRSQGPALALSLGLMVAGSTLVALSARRTYRRQH